jgi:hypothetical protein
MSLASVSRTERSLGHSLPTDESGQHVILTRRDLERLQDPDTLQFLHDHSELFSKYTAAAHHDESSLSSSTTRPHERNSCDDIQKHVDALCTEIETFMTAVDFEGNTYHIHLDEMGELRVPLVSTDGGGGDDLLLDGMMMIGGGVLDTDSDRPLVTEEDFAQFDAEFGLQDPIADEDPPDGQEEEEAGDPAFDIDPFHRVDAEGDSCSSVNMASATTTVDAPDQDVALTLQRRPLLEKLLDAGPRQRLQMIIKHHRSGGAKPRYMATTEARKFSQQQQKPEDPTTAPPHGPPQPPAAPSPPPARGFTVQHCSAQRRSGPATATPRPQRQTLSVAEERRVQFILDNEQWEEGLMATPQLHAHLAQQVELGETDDARSDGAVTKKSMQSAASSSLLAYDETSAASYAAATGGYVPTPQLTTKLQSIENRLALLRAARERSHDAPTGAPPSSARSAAAPTTATTPEVTAARDGGKHTRKAPASAARTTSNNSDAASSAALTEQAEKAAVEALRRKQLGNNYLTAVREDQQVRREMSDLNDRLQRLHEAMDELVTPPFAFNTTYEMKESPESWRWPDSTPPPTADQLAVLLRQAAEENMRYATIAAAKAKSDEKKAATMPAEDDSGAAVVEEEEEIAAESQQSLSSASSIITPFLANLRARFESATRIAEELAALHEYRQTQHSPPEEEFPSSPMGS